MPEIPVGKVTFSISGKPYEISAPDMVVHLSGEITGHAFLRGLRRGKEEALERVADKLAQMIQDCDDRIRGEDVFLVVECLSARRDSLEEMRQWLKEEA